MATRGRRPTPPSLRLINGTAAPAERKAAKENQPAPGGFGPLRKPAGLKAEASKAWDAWVKPASWLDGSREPVAWAFCELWAQFAGKPSAFTPSLHGQLRAYMQELGLTDERRRTGPLRPKEKDEFFDD